LNLEFSHRINKIESSYYVDLIFDHKVTSTVFIIKFPLDSYWELQFSNPEKGPKPEDNYRHHDKAGYRLLMHYMYPLFAATLLLSNIHFPVHKPPN